MTVNDMDVGQKARVIDVKCENDLKHHLGSLGLFEGVLVQVICKSFGVSTVEVLCSTRLGISDDVLSSIYVSVI